MPLSMEYWCGVMGIFDRKTAVESVGGVVGIFDRKTSVCRFWVGVG